MPDPKVCKCGKPPLIHKVYIPFENENMKFNEIHYECSCCRKVPGDTADAAVINWNRG